MIKRLLGIDTVIIVVLLGCAYFFNSMICFGAALFAFILDLVALINVYAVLKNPENKS